MITDITQIIELIVDITNVALALNAFSFCANFPAPVQKCLNCVCLWRHAATLMMRDGTQRVLSEDKLARRQPLHFHHFPLMWPQSLA